LSVVVDAVRGTPHGQLTAYVLGGRAHKPRALFLGWMLDVALRNNLLPQSSQHHLLDAALGTSGHLLASAKEVANTVCGHFRRIQLRAAGMTQELLSAVGLCYTVRSTVTDYVVQGSRAAVKLICLLQWGPAWCM
jgi:hypothetical protein